MSSDVAQRGYDSPVTHGVTVIQPYPAAILSLGKDVENRSSAPSSEAVGTRIAIHSGQKVNERAVRALRRKYRGLLPAALETGAILGTARLLGYFRPDGTGETFAGRYFERMDRALKSEWRLKDAKCLWLLDDPCVFSVPLKCRGQLGLWKIPSEVPTIPSISLIRMLSRSTVRITSDSGKAERWKTRSMPWQLETGEWVVLLAGRQDAFPLTRCELVERAHA